MKKIWLATCLVVFLAASPALAQEIGQSVGMLEKGAFTVGLQGAYVSKMKFKDYDLKRGISGVGAQTAKKSAEFKDDAYYAATLAYGVTDWLGVFASLGMVDGGKWMDKDLATGEQWEAKLKSNFAWAVGAKARVWEMEKGPGLLASVRYMRYDNRKVEDWRNNSKGYGADAYWSTSDEMDYWQVDVNAVGYWPLGSFTPYVGLGYSYSEAKLSGAWSPTSGVGSSIDYDSTMKLKDNLSALVGFDVDLGKNFILNLQGTFVARTAVSLAINYMF